MNRIKDYIGFAAWFAGLGYSVVAVTANELGGEAFGAFIFCRDGSFGIMDFLCTSAQPLRMPPGLHALGFMSAVFVTSRLLFSAAKRSRRAVRGEDRRPLRLRWRPRMNPRRRRANRACCTLGQAADAFRLARRAALSVQRKSR